MGGSEAFFVSSQLVTDKPTLPLAGSGGGVPSPHGPDAEHDEQKSNECAGFYSAAPRGSQAAGVLRS